MLRLCMLNILKGNIYSTRIHIYDVKLRNCDKIQSTSPYGNSSTLIRHITSNAQALPDETPKRNLSEQEYLVRVKNDPDVFGSAAEVDQKPDEGDLKEEKYLENPPTAQQKLRTKQYADIIKELLRKKKLKEAIDVVEVRMLKEDRVKPESYIFNLILGGCGRVGYTKKAFSLYNNMKKRGLNVTGGTYTALFNACANSPWPEDGLSRAKHLRDIMIEKCYEPNDMNYNAMIKAFGRCGDLATAFALVDEMNQKKFLIKDDTINFLLQACITDKQAGFRHCLLVWRKFIDKNISPSIYSYNLLLKCVRECGLGDLEVTKDVIDRIIQGQKDFSENNVEGGVRSHLLKSKYIPENRKERKVCDVDTDSTELNLKTELTQESSHEIDKREVTFSPLDDTLSNKNTENQKEQKVYDVDTDRTELNLKTESNELPPESSQAEKHSLEIDKREVTFNPLDDTLSKTNTESNSIVPTQNSFQENRPNLIAKVPHLGSVLSLSEVTKAEDRLLLIGGCSGFLQDMFENHCTPDIKTFTQLLEAMPSTVPAEKELLSAMKRLKVKPDVDFYNMLIKKRSMRFEYDSSQEVLRMMKKARMRPDLVTYGVLALGCKTREQAQMLLQEMSDGKYRMNAEILGAMLSQACHHYSFSYVLEIMEICIREDVRPNKKFMEHLEEFKKECKNLTNDNDNSLGQSRSFQKGFQIFKMRYKNWKTEVDPIDEDEVHPWQQFRQEIQTDVRHYKDKEAASRFKQRHTSLFRQKTSSKFVADKSKSPKAKPKSYENLKNIQPKQIDAT